MQRRPPSRLEVRLLASELDRYLSGARVSNIYSNTELGLTLLKLNGSDGPHRLLHERGLRACLTEFRYPAEKSPHPQLRTARRLLRGSRVQRVEQEGFDRVISIELSTPRGSSLKLVLEMLSGGVFVILDSEGKVRFTTEKKVMRDRSILLGEEYRLPPQTYPSPLLANKEELLRILNEESVVKPALATRLGLGNLSDLICLNAGIDPEAIPTSLSPEGTHKLLDAIRQTVESLKLAPTVYSDGPNPIEYSLVPLPNPPSQTSERFDTVSEAMDWYYSIGGKMRIVAPSKPNRRLASLKKTAEELLQQSAQLKEIAEMIMADAAKFDRVLSLAKQGTKGAIEAGINVKEIDYRERTAKVLMGGREAQLDITRSAAANASVLFSRSKELRSRAGELMAEAESTKVEQKVKEVELKRVRKMAWYEKFRWAVLSSSRKLLLGKDAITNEILVKKHTDENTQVFHSDFAGSPFAVAWPPGEMTEGEIQEAAGITASYTSKAWEMGFSSLDVYWVRASQLSKSPPSGTFLTKGAFFVSGEKNFIRGANLGIALGAELKENKLYVTTMPPNADAHIPRCILAPGRHTNSEVSRRLAKMLADRYSVKITAEVSDAIRERMPDKKSDIIAVKGL
jgi:predicted ribosome quality control (RQC) complex YloA/Tae2 family protein